MGRSNHIVEPPDTLDGAKVIKWAWSGQDPFGYVKGDDGTRTGIHGLAICQYDDSTHVYRFSCDENWVIQQDSSYDSIEIALRQLPDQYKLITAKWMTKENL